MQNVNLLVENYLSHYILKALWKWTLEGEHIFLMAKRAKQCSQFRNEPDNSGKVEDAMFFSTISIFFFSEKLHISSWEPREFPRPDHYL